MMAFRPPSRCATLISQPLIILSSRTQSRAFSSVPPIAMAGKDQESKEKRARKPPAPLRMSSSVILLSPTNQVLLLHRVGTSSSFAKAHVFPGGNVSSFHDGTLPDQTSPVQHRDGPAYRLAAIRETFEESGILLARKPGQVQEQGLLHVPDDAREAGRKQVHGNQVPFPKWLSTLGGEPDLENLIPFTRWITPIGPPKRFTTQMYLYMLPLSSSSPISDSSDPSQTHQTLIPTPTHDGGLEHTAATFDNVHTWLAQARAGSITLFPPQFYLLHLLSSFLPAPADHPTQSGKEWTAADYAAQRAAILAFINSTPTAAPHPKDRLGTHLIPWADKVISPEPLPLPLPPQGAGADKRTVLRLDRPGPELKGSGRGGDWSRVVRVTFEKGTVRDVEVEGREVVVEGEGEGEGARGKL